MKCGHFIADKQQRSLQKAYSCSAFTRKAMHAQQFMLEPVSSPKKRHALPRKLPPAVVLAAVGVAVVETAEPSGRPCTITSPEPPSSVSWAWPCVRAACRAGVRGVVPCRVTRLDITRLQHRPLQRSNVRYCKASAQELQDICKNTAGH